MPETMVLGAGMEVVIDRTSLDKAVGDLSARMRDPVRLFDEIASYFNALERQIFNQEGAFRGARWDENSPGYAAKKRAHYGGKPVMELTGALRQSLTTKGGPGTVRDITADTLVVGTSLSYAAKHHEGSSDDFYIPEPFNMTVHGVPARPLMAWADEDTSVIEGLALEWAEKGTLRGRA